MAERDYPKAETVAIETRMAALRYVVDCVKASYGPNGIALRNVTALVDGVADAVVDEDAQAMLVRGTRLLSLAQLDHVVGLLRTGTTHRVPSVT